MQTHFDPCVDINQTFRCDSNLTAKSLKYVPYEFATTKEEIPWNWMAIGFHGSQISMGARLFRPLKKE